ncbi:TPA: s-adenosyl-L-methionine-dependent methyltransferase, partial [Haemophilus influenzae]
MANQNTFKQAPLPFIGQKRMFLKHFETVLNENIKGEGEGWIIIDTFGGSGLLSHTAKRLKPKARVIYNDFDGYAERLAHIDDINQLRAELYSVVGNATS